MNSIKTEEFQSHLGNDLISTHETLEAESMIIGAIFLEPDIIHEISLEPEHFSLAKNRILYKTLRELANEDTAIDVVTVTDRLSDKLELIGGISYITKIAVSCPTTANVHAYERIVLEQFKKRNLLAAAQKFLKEQSEKSLDDFYTKYIEMQEIGNEGKRGKNDVLVEIFEEMHQDTGEITGIDTGFIDLNEMTGGLQNGDLIIIAGRPSMGKTAFALNIAGNNCMNGGVSDVFSLEMPEKQLVKRMLSSIANIPGSKWRNPYRMFNEKDYENANKALEVYSSWDIYIHDDPNQTIADIRARVRKTQKKHPNQKHLVVIDYLQLITILGKFERHDLAIFISH